MHRVSETAAYSCGSAQLEKADKVTCTSVCVCIPAMDCPLINQSVQAFDSVTLVFRTVQLYLRDHFSKVLLFI